METTKLRLEDDAKVNTAALQKAVEKLDPTAVLQLRRSRLNDSLEIVVESVNRLSVDMLRAAVNDAKKDARTDAELTAEQQTLVQRVDALEKEVKQLKEKGKE